MADKKMADKVKELEERVKRLEQNQHIHVIYQWIPPVYIYPYYQPYTLPYQTCGGAGGTIGVSNGNLTLCGFAGFNPNANVFSG